MPTWTLNQVAEACRAGWTAETCDPVDLPEWSHVNRARGQCGVTALVVHDLLGGELMIAEVLRLDGSRQGVHYWNRLPDGVEVDLTIAQFDPDEIVQVGHAVIRPQGQPPKRCGQQYALLRERVVAALDGTPRTVD